MENSIPQFKFAHSLTLMHIQQLRITIMQILSRLEWNGVDEIRFLADCIVHHLYESTVMSRYAIFPVHQERANYLAAPHAISYWCYYSTCSKTTTHQDLEGENFVPECLLRIMCLCSRVHIKSGSISNCTIVFSSSTSPLDQVDTTWTPHLAMKWHAKTALQH